MVGEKEFNSYKYQFKNKELSIPEMDNHRIPEELLSKIHLLIMELTQL